MANRAKPLAGKKNDAQAVRTCLSPHDENKTTAVPVLPHQSKFGDSVLQTITLNEN